MITRTIPREVTPQEIGWLAGILDGEGSIAFGKSKNKGSKFGYNYYHGIHIVNTNQELIEKSSDIIFRLCDDIPTKAKMSKIDLKIYKNPAFKQNKQCHEICLRNKVWTIRILTILLPYLTEKRKRATALIKIINTLLKASRDKNGKLLYSYYTPKLETYLTSIWNNARND